MTEARRACLRALAGALALPLLSAVGEGGAAARPRTGHRRHSAPPRPTMAHVAPDRIRPVIVVDPGHGGADPGAVGRSGTLEKTVALATALELHRVLAATGHYRVLLTRRDDRFVSLAERAAFGPAHKAALVISLHADASPDPRTRGASVYVRSDGPRGAAGELRRVASGTAKPAAIARALGASALPLRTGSARLQRAMIDSLDDDVRMTAAPARAAHLWVLASRGIPGVLVEMGFLSNRRDEKLLRDPRHRRLIAHSLRDAVDDYFRGLGRSAAPRT